MLMSAWLSSYYEDIFSGVEAEVHDELCTNPGWDWQQEDFDALYFQACHSGQVANWLQALDTLSWLQDEDGEALRQDITRAQLDDCVQEAQAIPGCCGLVYDFVCEFVN